MRRSALLGVVAVFALLLGGGGGAVAASASATAHKPVSTAKAKAKVRCRVVVVAKTKKRRRVCVAVRRPPRPRPPVRSAQPAAVNTIPGAAPASPDQVPAGAPHPAGQAPTPDASAAAPPVASTPLPPAPARLQVTAREFFLQLSRPSVAAGELLLELVNRGEDPHDLHLRPADGGAAMLSTPVTDPFGGVSEATGTLAAGSFTLFCALPGHEAAGMKASLTVG